MRRHSKAGDGPRRRKTAPKRSHAPKPARRRRSAAPGPAAKIARLRRELNEASELQKATSEVLRVIASSTGDLERVFETILANAVRICDAANGAINRWDGEILQLVATHNMPPAFAEARKLVPYRPDENSASGRLLMHKALVHIPDLAADRAYAARSPTTVAAVELAGVRTTLAVPMFKDNELVGSFTVGRREVRPFTDKQIEIVQNFAAQAVIAVENARLLNELRQRTDELGRSVADLQRERDNKLMNLEAMAASIGHEVRQPLAGISSNGGAALRFLGHTPPNIEEARLALQRMVKDSHRASQVFDNIRTLFGKADQGHEPIDVNELALGVLQALREELKDHRITTQAELTSQLPFVMGHRGQLQEVFINLVHNAIEAMDAVDGDDRILRVRAERHGGNAIIVAVEDSGPGIDPQQLKTIFDAFITTKPNGLGLGLAICRLIIERHKGQPFGRAGRAARLGVSHRPACRNAGCRMNAEAQPIVLVIDDDAPLREALSSLFRSVGLQVKTFGSAPGISAKRRAGRPELPGARRPIAGPERARFPGRTRQGQYPYSDRVHDRPRRYSDDRAGDESGRGGVPAQAVSRSGHAGCRANRPGAGPQPAQKRGRHLQAEGKLSTRSPRASRRSWATSPPA